MYSDESMRYIPTIEKVDWDISDMEKDEKVKLRNRLVVRITHSEEEFQAVMSYMHMKYPDLMDKYENDGKKLQWRYIPYNEKVNAIDAISGNNFGMYGLIYYDAERDMEPIAVGGSYLKSCGPLRYSKTHSIIPGQNIDATGHVHIGHGYIIFIDPDYRRLGLAEAQWLTEAQLYRDSNIQYQKENQTDKSLKVTQAMFDDPEKCIILSRGKTNYAGVYTCIKCAMDYTDESLVTNFNVLGENIKDFRKPADWTFLQRENLTIEKLIQPWSKHKNIILNECAPDID